MSCPFRVILQSPQSGKSKHEVIVGRLTPLDEILLDATLLNDVKGVKAALDRGADVNVSRPDLVRPIHMAAERGFTEVAAILVQRKGIRLNELTIFGKTPLVLATFHENYPVLRVLLQAGANPNKKHLFDQTPLHIAAFEGRMESAKELIRFGADVNRMDCFDQTPLYLSLIALPNPMMTRLLLNAGADPHHSYTKFQEPILTQAVLNASTLNHIRAISFLIKQGANIHNADGVKGDTALHKAALTGYVPLIRFLVRNGADMSVKNKFGQTPIQIAQTHGNIEAVEELKLLTEEEEDFQIMKMLKSAHRKIHLN